MNKALKKIVIPSIVTLTLIFVNSAFACPWCNNKFYNELVGERSGSLVSQELMAAIMNQSSLYPAPVGAGSSTYVAPTGSTFTPPDQNKPEENNDFIEIISRDNGLSIPPTSYVPQDTKWDKEVTIELSEGETYIGKGVMFKGFVTNVTIPGPTLIVDEGDVVKFTVVNKGTIPHGASIHSAYTQTSKYLGKIPAGETRSMVFRVNQPGVYLYHCAPGGHAIPMHIIFGQYGMMVVKPKKQYKLEQILHKKPDVEVYLLQHELYSNGQDAIDSKPIYTLFNGKLFRYVEEPIKAKPGDYVRIYFLNAGPNLISTFHIVGIIWDFAYWQGNPDVSYPGGQSVLAGPTDSWVVEFRMPPDEGAYTMLTHAVGSTDRGAIGILACDKNAQTPLTVMSDGPKYNEQQFADIKSKVTRVVSPFEPGTADVDAPVVYGPETKEVTVKIIGNSFNPKRIQIAEGTTVKWVNEDVFSYMEGEFAGIHNAISYEGPENFQGPLLAHGETFKFTFNKGGEYKYMCTPHPYMRGEITVGGDGTAPAGRSSNLAIGFMGTIAGLMLLLVGIRFFEFRISGKNGKNGTP